MGQQNDGFKVFLLRKNETSTVNGDARFHFIFPSIKDPWAPFQSQIIEKVEKPLLNRGKYYL